MAVSQLHVKDRNLCQPPGAQSSQLEFVMLLKLNTNDEEYLEILQIDVIFPSLIILC